MPDYAKQSFVYSIYFLVHVFISLITPETVLVLIFFIERILKKYKDAEFQIIYCEIIIVRRNLMYVLTKMCDLTFSPIFTLISNFYESEAVC